MSRPEVNPEWAADDTIYPDFTLSGTWRNAITPETCAAVKLVNRTDQSYSCDIINYFYTEYPNSTHNINQFEDSYVIDFDKITKIDLIFLKKVVARYNSIRDITVSPISAVDSPTNTPYFCVKVEVFYAGGDNIHKPVPQYSPVNVIPCPITKENFTEVVGTDTWQVHWLSAFGKLRDICTTVCNIGNYPSDMGIVLLYDTTESKKEIFGIKFTNIGDTSYSLIEYMDIVHLKDFMYLIKFESDQETHQNSMVIKFIERQPDSQATTSLGGELFISGIKKRFHSSGDIQNVKKRPREEDDVPKPDMSKSEVKRDESPPKKKRGFFAKLFSNE